MFRQVFEFVDARRRDIERVAEFQPFVGGLQWRDAAQRRVDFLNSGVALLAVSDVELFDEFGLTHRAEDCNPVFFGIGQYADPSIFGDRKSTRLNSITNANSVCLLLLTK